MFPATLIAHDRLYQQQSLTWYDCDWTWIAIFASKLTLFSLQSFAPTQIFQEGTTEEKGENARLAAFVGAIAVGDLVKSTLGPKGMDKILQSA